MDASMCEAAGELLLVCAKTCAESIFASVLCPHCANFFLDNRLLQNGAIARLLQTCTCIVHAKGEGYVLEWAALANMSVSLADVVARLLVLLGDSSDKDRSMHVLRFLRVISPIIHPLLCEVTGGTRRWFDALDAFESCASSEWLSSLHELVNVLIVSIDDPLWQQELSQAFVRHLSSLYDESPLLRAVCVLELQVLTQ